MTYSGLFDFRFIFSRSLPILIRDSPGFLFEKGHRLMAQSEKSAPACSLRQLERVIPILDGGRYTSYRHVPHDFLEGRMCVDGLLPGSADAIWAAFSCPRPETSVDLPVRTFSRKCWNCFLCPQTFSTPFELDVHVPTDHPTEHFVWLSPEFKKDNPNWLHRCPFCG